MAVVFFHGLDSSSKGRKGAWFREHFPEMLVPDFAGTLDDRMAEARSLLSDLQELVLVGSSFGGLMATVYAWENTEKVKKVILLAPALNFPDFALDPGRKISVPSCLYIGSRDDVCPPQAVIPIAREIFSDLTVHESDDDHLLRNTFAAIDWQVLLAG